jgi:hypothetical protein
MEKDESVVLTARIPVKVKKRLEDYCQGEVDGEKHVQESVVGLAINRYLDRAEKFERK